MSVDARRVFLIALALGFGGALLLVRLLRPAPHPEPVAAPTAPVMDVSDPAIRRVLQQVAANGEPTSAIYRTCTVDQPDRIRLSTMPGNEPEARAHELRIIRRGDGASVEYFERPFRGPFEGEPEESEIVHRKAALDAAEWRELDKLFADARYPHAVAPADDGVLCVVGGWRRIESCLGGRYHAAFRTCHTEEIDPLAKDVYSFVRAKIEQKGQALPPQPVVFDGEVVRSRHGAYARRYDRDESYALSVADDARENAGVEHLFEMSGPLKVSVVRGRFTGVLKGPTDMERFELQSAERLERVEP